MARWTDVTDRISSMVSTIDLENKLKGYSKAGVLGSLNLDDTTIVSGIYSFVSNQIVGGTFPDAIYGNYRDGCKLIVTRHTDTFTSQIILAARWSRAWMRTRYGDIWNAWVEITN